MEEVEEVGTYIVVCGERASFGLRNSLPELRISLHEEADIISRSVELCRA